MWKFYACHGYFQLHLDSLKDPSKLSGWIEEANLWNTAEISLKQTVFEKFYMSYLSCNIPSLPLNFGNFRHFETHIQLESQNFYHN